MEQFVIFFAPHRPRAKARSKSVRAFRKAGENFPSLDNLAEYITAYYQAVTGGGC
jgi:hypothetical protein